MNRLLSGEEANNKEVGRVVELQGRDCVTSRARTGCSTLDEA